MKAPKIKKYQDGGTPKYATRKMNAKEWDAENAKAGRVPYSGSAEGREGHKQYFDPKVYKEEKDPSTGLFKLARLDNKDELLHDIYTYDYSKPKEAAIVSKVPSPAVAEGHKPLVIGTAGTYDPNTGTTYIDPSKKTGTIEPIVEQYKSGGKIMKAPSLKKKVGKYANGGPLTPEEQSQGAYIQNGVKYSANGTPIMGDDTFRTTGTEGEITSATTQPLTNGTEFKVSGDAVSTGPQATVNAGAPAQQGQKKGGGGTGDKVGASMGWLQYANMAKDIGKGLIKRDEITDPNTGQKYSYAKDRNSAGIDKAITPYHEKWQNDYKEGDMGSMAATGAGMLIGGPLTEIAYEGLIGEKKDKDRFEKKKATFEAQSNTAQNMGTRNERSSLAKGGTIKGPGTGKSDSILSRIGDKGIASGSFIVPEENNEMAKSIRAKILGDNPEKTASFKKLNGGGETEADVAVSNGEHLFTPKEKKKITAMLGEEVLEKLAPEAEENDEMNCGGKVKLKDGGTVPEGTKLGKYYYKKGNWIDASGNKLTKEFGQKYTDAYFKQTGGKSKDQLEMEADVRAANEKNNPGYNSPTKTADQLASLQDTKPSQLGPKKAPKSSGKKTGVEFVPKMTEDTGDFPVVPGTKESVSFTEAIDPVFKQKAPMTDAGADLLVTSAKKASDEYVPQTETKRGSSVLSGIGSAMEYAMPIAQGIMGYDYLNKAGKRPVDAMDPDFVQSVEKAKQNAMFGFAPEEKFAIDQQNQNLTNAARFTARNLSGGSAAVAQSNERAAINDAYMRGLDSVIKGKQLQMDKQFYADQTIQAKQNKSRQLFQDTLGAWNQNQQAGASLLASGLQGLIGAKRYQETLNTMQEEEAARNAYKNIDYSKLIK